MSVSDKIDEFLNFNLHGLDYHKILTIVKVIAS